MKAIYKTVTTILRGDTTLKNLIGYTTTKKNIKRAYSPPDGKWNKYVLFYLQPDSRKTDFTSKIRDIPLIVRVYDRTGDVSCSDVTERIVILLDEANLSEAGVLHVYSCLYTGAIIPITWDAKLKCFEKALRFMVVVRVE